MEREIREIAKNRRLKPNAAIALKFINGFAVGMQIFVTALAFSLLFMCEYADSWKWCDVGYMVACLAMVIFWGWIGSVVKELLKYE